MTYVTFIFLSFIFILRILEVRLLRSGNLGNYASFCGYRGGGCDGGGGDDDELVADAHFALMRPSPADFDVQPEGPMCHGEPEADRLLEVATVSPPVNQLAMACNATRNISLLPV